MGCLPDASWLHYHHPYHQNQPSCWHSLPFCFASDRSEASLCFEKNGDDEWEEAETLVIVKSGWMVMFVFEKLEDALPYLYCVLE